MYFEGIRSTLGAKRRALTSSASSKESGSWSNKWITTFYSSCEL